MFFFFWMEVKPVSSHSTWSSVVEETVPRQIVLYCIVIVLYDDPWGCPQLIVAITALCRTVPMELHAGKNTFTKHIQPNHTRTRCSSVTRRPGVGQVRPHGTNKTSLRHISETSRQNVIQRWRTIRKSPFAGLGSWPGEMHPFILPGRPVTGFTTSKEQARERLRHALSQCLMGHSERSDPKPYIRSGHWHLSGRHPAEPLT